MTQYNQFRCEMTNFRIHSQVHICLHKKPLRVQHSVKNKDLDLIVVFRVLSLKPEAFLKSRILWSGLSPLMDWDLNAYTVQRCFMLTRHFILTKSKREHTSSAGKKRKLSNCHFLRWASKMVKFKMPINLHLVPLLQ